MKESGVFKQLTQLAYLPIYCDTEKVILHFLSDC